MHDQSLDAGFSVLTNDEQVATVGGDAEFARTIGYGVGYAAHWMEAGLMAWAASVPRAVNYGFFAKIAQ